MVFFALVGLEAVRLAPLFESVSVACFLVFSAATWLRVEGMVSSYRTVRLEWLVMVYKRWYDGPKTNNRSIGERGNRFCERGSIGSFTTD